MKTKYYPKHYYFIQEVNGEEMAFDLGEGILRSELLELKHKYEEKEEIK